MSDFGNLASMFTSVTGTGPITSFGTVVPSYISFTQAGITAGNYVTYGIKDGLSREVGRGLISGSGASMQMTRQVLNSTNNNNLLSLTGNAIVYITAVNEDLDNVGDVRDWGAKVDGSTDDTVAIQAAIDSATAKRRIVQLGFGTSVVDRLTLPSGAIIRGYGIGASVLQRKSGSSQNSVVWGQYVSGISLRDFSIDGNRNNNSTVGHNFRFLQCSRVQIEGCESYNSFAHGIAFTDGTDSGFTRSTARNCYIHDNGNVGVQINRSGYITVASCTIANCANGIVAADANYPHVADTVDGVFIESNTVSNMTTDGICVGGFVNGGGAGNPTYGTDQMTSKNCHVSHNTVTNCGSYGIVFQCQFSQLDNNTVRGCGNWGGSVPGGGSVCNSSESTYTGNSFSGNNIYNMDAGGSHNVTITGNSFDILNGGAGTSINLGAATECTVSGNIINAASGQTALNMQGIDGSGTPFNWKGTTCTVSGNKFNIWSGALGIWVSRNFRNPKIYDNFFTGYASLFDFIRLETGSFPQVSGNRSVVNDISIPTFNSDAYLVLPDDCEEAWISGAGTIYNIVTYTASQFSGRVRDVNMTSFGSGYSSAPNVSFSGGGGSGASANAELTANGTIIGVAMTGNGSGYTSRPDVSFSGGGGSGASGIASIGCSNHSGRRLVLCFTGGARVSASGGNIAMRGDFLARAGMLSTLSLYGTAAATVNGVAWSEIARGNESGVV